MGIFFKRKAMQNKERKDRGMNESHTENKDGKGERYKRGRKKNGKKMMIGKI